MVIVTQQILAGISYGMGYAYVWLILITNRHTNQKQETW